MSKAAEFKTNVMRILEQAKVPFRHHCYVDSALFSLVRKPVIPSRDIRIILSRLARTSFAHRRKKMFKQAAAVFGTDVIAAAMADASVDPDIRAERVTVDQFIRMAEFIAAHAQIPPETAQNDETDTCEDAQE